ncbi:MAG: HD domain-containing protein [Lewinellaceae bacterium]|nr:HD domain-containing protein [Lewinellaceae bacterium]
MNNINKAPLPPADAVWAIFHSRGHEEYHGEPVSQWEHAVQSAELALKERPGDPEFILAAFLHDFGHICADQDEAVSMEGYGAVRHEQVGAEALRQLGFSEKIAALVAGHVQAKRYLVATDTAYYARLSEASKYTLEQQGGLMSPAERGEFERDPLFPLHVQLRRIDERAKANEYRIGNLGWLENLIRGHFENHPPKSNF